METTNPLRTNSKPDCAVGRFSDTFSSTSRRRHVLSPSIRNAAPTSITSLPSELLLIIFKLVHNMGSDTSLLPPAERVWWRPLSDHLFPYNVASVCSVWRDLTSLVPEFWTTLVALVDSPRASLTAVKAQLAWSRNLPLKVLITQHDPFEVATRVKSVMNTLQLHLHRFSNLEINVGSSSSLPSFPFDFHGSAPLLEYIKLSCKEDDGGPTRTQADDADSRSATPANQLFHCPVLQHLTVDGRNFFNACQRNIRWTSMFSNIRTLNVLNFKPRASHFESFTTTEFISSLDPLQFLHLLYISNLDLAPSRLPYDLEYPPFLEFANIDIELEDLSNPNTVFELVDVLGVPHSSVSIMGCAVDQLPDYEGALALIRVPKDHDLIPILRSFQGTKLSLDDCPGFHDRILEMMTPTCYQPGQARCAPHVQQLVISNCPNISVAVLKRLIETRCSELGGHIPITELHLYADVPELLLDDVKWFEDRVLYFTYFRYDPDNVEF